MSESLKAAGGGCPEGFESFGGSCYHFGSHASYVSASAKCQEYSAELVSVHDRNLGRSKGYINREMIVSAADCCVFAEIKRNFHF